MDVIRQQANRFGDKWKAFARIDPGCVEEISRQWIVENRFACIGYDGEEIGTAVKFPGDIQA